MFSLNGKGSGFDALYWIIVHNGNRRRILKEFMVCILDVPSNTQMRLLPNSSLENFRGIPDKRYIPIKTVYTVTCGSKNGTFSDDDAKIQLVRDNNDMKTPIFGKV